VAFINIHKNSIVRIISILISLYSLTSLAMSAKSSGQKKPHVYDHLERLNQHYELKRLNKAFDNIDDLFATAQVKYQRIEDEDKLGKEHVTSLHFFLSQPHGFKKIQTIIEKSTHKRINLASYQDLRINASLHQVVNFLWERSILTDPQAIILLHDNAPLSPQELINLVENGIIKSAKGFLVQLRTGHNFGDPLKLLSDVDRALRELQKDKDYEAPIRLADIELPLNRKTAKKLKNLGISNEQLLLDAQVIQQMREHFLFLSSLGMPIRFRPTNIGFGPNSPPGPVSINNSNSFNAAITPRSLSALMVGNYYMSSINASTSNSLFVNPMGIGYSGSLSFNNQGPDWWLYYTNGYLGGGGSYTINFDQGTLWSKGQASYLSLGFMASGWKDYLSAGISLQTLLSHNLGVGVSASVTVTRSHDVSYIGPYPVDGKFAAIRGLHKIEINDQSGISKRAAGSINFSALSTPLAVAFRAGADHTVERIFRTHVDLAKSRSMLSEASIPGLLLIAGKKIKESKIPGFDKPENLIDGDELVEKKIGTLSGAFVIGLESLVHINAARVGGSVEVSGEFELGLKRLPNNKYEVSIEPTKVVEIGLFASILNIVGVGYIKGIAIARKQIFSFDFNHEEAKRAYFDLIHHGRMPTNEEIEVYSEDRGPEYLLTEVRSQNDILRPRGIERIYLEKIRITTSKKHIGITAPIVPAILALINKVDKKVHHSKKHVLRFEGVDREFMHAEAKSVATNGIISVRRNTFGGRLSRGQGTKGRYNRDLYVTHRRIHSIDDSPYSFADNKWQFDSLIIHAQLEDTMINGDDENKMARKINRLFGAYIGSFEEKNSKTARTINIERELSRRDLMILSSQEAHDRVNNAALASGIERPAILNLVEQLKNKHPDQQGLMVKHFIETSRGFRGFAAIHHLLGGKPEELFIHTKSGYMSAVHNLKTFIIENTENNDQDKPRANLNTSNSHENKKHIKEFYHQSHWHLRNIDHQLRLLKDDKYLLDENSQINGILGEKKITELISSGARQDKSTFKTALISARNSLLELLDLEEAGFNCKERLNIYELAHEKCLGLKEKAEILINKYQDTPIDPYMSKNEIRKRMTSCWDIIEKIDSRVDKLNNDEIIKSYDSEYIDKQIKLMSELRDVFEKIISLEHLSQQDAESIKNKFSHNEHNIFGIFRHKRHQEFKIEGAITAIANFKNHKSDNTEQKTLLETKQKTFPLRKPVLKHHESQYFEMDQSDL